MPQEWKLGIVVPVFKKGSKNLVENYRPISLTCIVMKIFEKLIRNELMARCSSILNINQHGFLPGKSCTTQMISFTESIAIALNNLIRTDVVYFDFAKAFDSVNHDLILNKLKRQFNIDGALLKFFVNYLKDRTQHVAISGSSSKNINVRSGVPQGSILGPLLFVIFINDMFDCVSDGTNIALYADDTKIWRQITSLNEQYILQNDIDALVQWSKVNKMNFHPDKCKVVPIAPPGKGLQDYFNKNFPLKYTYFYHLDHNDLDFVESEKDLGVMVTSTLSWDAQVDYLYSKASSRLGLLKRALHFVKCPQQKRVFYLAITRSLFEHCVQVWRPSCDTAIMKLERIKKRAVKWILSEQIFSYNDVEYLARLQDLNLVPIKYRFIFSDLSLFHKIFYKKCNIDLPEYYVKYSDEDRKRLRSSIKPPDYLGGNKQTINLEELRKAKFNELSLKCTLNVIIAKYKT